MESAHLPNFDPSPWVPGGFSGEDSESYPLMRYFPPVPHGMVSAWVQKYADTGSFLLDPFGQNPYTSLELARSGYRVLVTANNPIAAFVLQVLAQAPSRQDFSDALSSLNQNPMRDGSTIEEYIRAFYRLDCPSQACQIRETPGRFEVDTIVWTEQEDSHEKFPSIAIGECPVCGLNGEIELNADLLESLGNTPSYALIRSQVLERIASEDPALRRVMEEVVSFYSPRAFIALHVLLNKIETSNLSQEQIRVLQALWLTTADQANQLWIWPRARHRPRQLIRPPDYQEANVWQAFVNSVRFWVHDETEVKLREWPRRVPPSGGISLFKGRLRELDFKPETDLITLVQSSLPRRNQAFWNLSGLWSGWLWGKKGIETIRNSLLKQRYDWTWHSEALRKVLSQLPALVEKDVPILLLTSELDSLFLLAGQLGAQAAGLQLKNAGIDGENELLQTVWRLPTQPLAPLNPLREIRSIQESGKNFLLQNGEPGQWLRMLSYTVADLVSSGVLQNRPKPGEMLNDIEAEFAAAFNDSSHFQRFNPGTTPEAGLYWLAQSKHSQASLADRVEAVILQELQMHRKLNFAEVCERVYASLPGFQTPPNDLILEILESYSLAENTETSERVFSILDHETAQARSDDLIAIRDILETMAQQLEFRRDILNDRILWLDERGDISYSFFPITTAQISTLLAANQHLPGQKLVVLPGSRSNLVALKLKRDPNLRLLKGDDWQLVKFRQLRNLMGNPLLSRDLFRSQISGDPPEFHTRQLALF